MANEDSNTIISPERAVFEEVNAAKMDCLTLSPLLKMALMNIYEHKYPEQYKNDQEELIALLEASNLYSKRLLDTVSRIESYEYQIKNAPAAVMKKP